MKTRLSIQDRRFFLNGAPVYSELSACPEEFQGLLLNARFIQGVFDDNMAPERFRRFGRTFDPDRNTDALIAALPAWYGKGLRAFTVGFQGGGPCFTLDNGTIGNNPYSPDGSAIDPAYLGRMQKIIEAADELGMVVIVSLLYGAQCRFFENDGAIRRAVETACGWLRKLAPTNVILEVANEFDYASFDGHPVIQDEKSMASLIDEARRLSGGLPVGCSGSGGYFSQAVAEASDVILVHGNGQSRQQLANLLKKAFAVRPARPVLCNEDSQAIGNLAVAMRAGASWGYYNNMTKQEPPTAWGIEPGADDFFARRMAMALGIEPKAAGNEFRLEGFEPERCYEGKRWIALSALYPEQIERVEFYRDGRLYDIAYDDPFTVHFLSNWQQAAVTDCVPGEHWHAEVYLADGTMVSLEEIVP